MRTLLLALSLSLGLIGAGFAQPAPPAAPAPAAPPGYNAQETFAPLQMADPANSYRTAAGTPGPNLWQNRANYDITATLTPATKTLTGVEVITYTNYSPDALDVLWLQLDQNIYRRDARAGAVGGGRPRTEFTDGYVLDKVEIDQGTNRFTPVHTLVSDTRLRIDLPSPLSSFGTTMRVRIAYHYQVPGKFGGRNGWMDSPHGEIYDIAQWYPRMAVYDDLHGWDTLPYLGNEFYLEYGDIDYSITLPGDMVVAGSGVLTNPQQVLTPDQIARLAQARASDKTVMIRTEAEVDAAQPSTLSKTWRFRMTGTRDVAFAASRAFVWDAARAVLPDGKVVLAQSVYPPESGGDAAWGRSTEYLKFAVEDFSRRWFPYPYPSAINVAGPAGAMEYPAVLFDSTEDKGKALFYLTEHEIGHTWFPMVVGTNERRWAWMDEGLNSFIDVYESDAFNHGEWGPKRDAEFAPGAGTPGDQIAALIADPAAPTIMTRPDAINFRYGHPISYFKTAYGMILLREDILGPDRFDPAFRKFIRDWAYRHPSPSDFFRAMESEGGEDLSWFWRGWFYHNWQLDMAVGPVSYADGDPAKGASITVSNLGQLVLPAKLRVAFKDGTTQDLSLPAETWIQSGTHVVTLESHQPIATVTLDPDHRLPDRDRSNNVWTAN